VYLGKALPDYAKSSLRMATQSSGLDIRLLTNVNPSQLRDLGDIALLNTQDFYDPAPFQAFAPRILNDLKFRKEFYSHVVERFFVLHQYIRKSNLQSLFHAELDQLLFGVDELLSNINHSNYRGLFFPFHSPNEAVASIFYCNSSDAFTEFLDFATRSGPFLNDMDLLAQFARSSPEAVVRLPTLSSPRDESVFGKSDLRSLDFSQSRGFVDAAQIGQWVGGADPRNYPLYRRPRTKFVDVWKEGLLTFEDLQDLHFNYSTVDSLLDVSSSHFQHARLYNLHLHSKLHNWLEKDSSRLQKFFDHANSVSSKLYFSSQRLQLEESHKNFNTLAKENFGSLTLRIGRRVNSRLNIRKSSHPFISGDTFRNRSNHVWESGRYFSPSNVSDRDVIFCESHLLEDLKKDILDKISCKVTLVLGNSDRNFGAELEDYSSLNSVEQIFCQNLLVKTPACTPIPIGLENRWLIDNGRICSYPRSTPHHAQRKPQVLWNFAMHTNLEVRRKAAASLLRNKNARYFHRMSNNQYYKVLQSYCFVASPPGNGFDCHRTWEAMYHGCIPIVQRSHFSEYFFDIGLPIWVVDSYEELVPLSESRLFEIYEEMVPRFSSETMWADYWLRQV
jgi:hypothetical protein